VSQALRFYLTRDSTEGWIEDAFDGTLYQRLVKRHLGDSTDPADLEDLTVWRLSNDPAELDDTGASWCPVMLSCLSLPPWIRRQLGAMHLGLLLPPGASNLQLVLPYFLEHLTGQQGCGLLGQVFIMIVSTNLLMFDIIMILYDTIIICECLCVCLLVCSC
jgi:hypothetical protein